MGWDDLVRGSFLINTLFIRGDTYKSNLQKSWIAYAILVHIQDISADCPKITLLKTMVLSTQVSCHDAVATGKQASNI